MRLFVNFFDWATWKRQRLSAHHDNRCAQHSAHLVAFMLHHQHVLAPRRPPRLIRTLEERSSWSRRCVLALWLRYDVRLVYLRLPRHSWRRRLTESLAPSLRLLKSRLHTNQWRQQVADWHPLSGQEWIMLVCQSICQQKHSQQWERKQCQFKLFLKWKHKTYTLASIFCSRGQKLTSKVKVKYSHLYST